MAPEPGVRVPKACPQSDRRWDDKTPLELFLTGVRGWDGVFGGHRMSEAIDAANDTPPLKDLGMSRKPDRCMPRVNSESVDILLLLHLQ